MPLDQVIQQLFEIIERQNERLVKLAVSSQPDPYHDIKLFFLGLMSALVAGYFSHRLEMRREEDRRKLEEWERLKDWARDGRKDDLRGTDLTPPLLWLRLRLPRRLTLWLPRSRYLDLERVNLRAGEEHEEGANLRRAKLPWANLRFAELQRVDLRDADLQGANLENANLQRANLQDADLRKADLCGTIMGMTPAERIAIEGGLAPQEDVSANLAGTNLRGAIANHKTVWPDGFQVPDTVVMVEE